MSRVEAAAAMDRLPWLSDEPDPQPALRRREMMIGGAAAAILLFAGVGYWLGTSSVEDVPAPAARRLPSTTVRLPEARPVAAPPQVVLRRAPEIEPIVAPPMPLIGPPPAAKSAPAAPEQTGALQPWPVRIVEGASGRLVRIGAFSTSHRAKRGWWAIVRRNPAVERLPALVVPVRSLRSGRVYYRLQMGTTSQAHSTVLCQRMRMNGQSCVVIGE
jgi:hypothetical protein